MQKVLFSTILGLVSFVGGTQTRATYACNPTAPLALVVPIPMPEPSSPAFLAIDLICVGGLILLFRPRSSGKNR